MHVLSLSPLSLLFSYVILSTSLVYLNDIPVELNITMPSLGKIPCPQIYPYNAWANTTNTQSGNLTLANDTTLATSSEILTFPTAYLVDPSTSTSKRAGLEEQLCRQLVHMYLNGAFVMNYNLPRTGFLQPGDKRIYVFSFKCNPGYVSLEVFARPVGRPEFRIKEEGFGNEGSGAVTFELQQPEEIRIRLDWGIYYTHTCEFALFCIDLV